MLIRAHALGRTSSRPDWERTPDERKVCTALEEVAKQVGAKSVQAVAIAYVMQKTPYVFPILGGRKVEHLEANIEALDVALSDEQVKYIESVLPFDRGFPHNFIVSTFVLCVLCGGSHALGRWYGVYQSHEERGESRQVAARCRNPPVTVVVCARILQYGYDNSDPTFLERSGV